MPEAEFVTRPRFSTLTYAGAKKITRLPRRTAVVAFSAGDVYRIAELVRRQRGGAAVVFGALSPRTRNAQVAMYQAGEVDYLVATDAIGMGLNMDIDHVAFAELVKFDGRHPRRLSAAELAQIAGRAGRHMSDGTFGTTEEVGPLDPVEVTAIEEHKFPALAAFYWRSRALDFASLPALLAALERPPPIPELIRKRDADDQLTLVSLARDPEMVALAKGRAAVELLWETCQIPDFRKSLSGSHTRLVGQIYRHLRAPGHRLPEDWVAQQVTRLDRSEGDIDLLLSRIAHIRTWTYVSHRPGWLEHASEWQERTRAVEDRLSDALHERLTEEYVDRPSAVLLRYDPAELITVVTEGGDVLVQGLRAGLLEGFRFRPDPSLRPGAKGLIAAANRSLRSAIRERVAAFVSESDTAFALLASGVVAWRGAAVGRLAAGESVLLPQVEVLASDLLDPPLRDQVRRRLAAWVEGQVRGLLGPLFAVRDGAPAGPGRGLAFALAESLGTLPPPRGGGPGSGAFPRRSARPGSIRSHPRPSQCLRTRAAAARDPASSRAPVRGPARRPGFRGARRRPLRTSRSRASLRVLLGLRLSGRGPAGGARGPPGPRGRAGLSPFAGRAFPAAARDREPAGGRPGRGRGGAVVSRLRRARGPLHAPLSGPARKPSAAGLIGALDRNPSIVTSL